MLLRETNDSQFDSNLDGSASTTTVATVDVSSKIFSILSDGIYKDKILAVVREVCCNAYDAHVAAGKKSVPIHIKMPTWNDPSFAVDDEGTGIDPSQITSIYLSYGKSTKTSSNDQIGALGLGCKSPLAYTKNSFIIKNRWNGTEYTYFIYLNERGIPAMSKTSEMPVSEANRLRDEKGQRAVKDFGLTVEFAVRKDDTHVFRSRVQRFFRYWGGALPEVSGVNDDLFSSTKVKKVLNGSDWFLEAKEDDDRDFRGAVAIQGNVPYPIEFDSLPKLPKELQVIVRNPFVIVYDMGSLAFQASREALSYDDITVKNLVERFEDVKADLVKTFNATVFKKGRSHLQFIHDLVEKFRTFQKSVSHITTNSTDVDDQYCQFLFGQPLETATVKYDGATFSIKDLLQGKIVTRHTTGHQNFTLMCLEPKGRSGRRTVLTHKTTVNYVLNKEMREEELFPETDHRVIPTKDKKIAKGQCFSMPWRTDRVNKKDDSDFANVIRHAKNFSITTVNRIPVQGRFGVAKVKIVLNDCVSTGDARMKALLTHIEYASKAVSPHFIYVTFDPKVTDVAEVKKQIEVLIQTGLKGAEIELLSSYPDHRAIVDREAKERGKFKLSTREIAISRESTTISLGYNQSADLNDVTFTDKQEVFSLDAMQAMPMVVYCYKGRGAGQFFDRSVNPDDRTLSLANNSDALSLAHHLGVLTRVFDEAKSCKVFTLAESQKNWLGARGVNLVPFEDLMIKYTAEMSKAAGDYRNRIAKTICIRNIGQINSFYSNYERLCAKNKTRFEGWANPSPFIDTVLTIMNQSNDKRDFMVEALNQRLNGSSIQISARETAAITKVIESRYPLLHRVYLSTHDKSIFEAILDYIDLVDQRAASAPAAQVGSDDTASA